MNLFLLFPIKKCIFEKTNVMISIILPVFNEDQNIDLMCQKLTEVLTENQEKFEIIFVNDGSGDSSLAILNEIARQDSRIKFISFTRNFGHPHLH